MSTDSKSVENSNLLRNPNMGVRRDPEDFPDAQTLERLVAEGKVNRKWHPDYPDLAVYKYRDGFDFYRDLDARVVQYCRGLVYDHANQKIVAFPFPKFFNHFNYSEEYLTTLFEEHNAYATPKQDGSCVLLWEYQGKWHWSTLGSFESEQAKTAKAIFSMEGNYSDLGTDYTYVFEVIYQDNRVVIDYGNIDKLVYLAQNNRLTGDERFNYSQFSKYLAFIEPVLVKRYATLDWLLDEVERRQDIEGYVVAFDRGYQRIKFKTKWYFEQTRQRSLLEREGLVKMVLYYPEEAAELDRENDLKYRADITHINISLDRLLKQVERVAWALRWLATRKLQAEAIYNFDVPGMLRAALFATLDGKHETAQRHVCRVLENETVDSIYSTSNDLVTKLNPPK